MKWRCEICGHESQLGRVKVEGMVERYRAMVPFGIEKVAFVASELEEREGVECESCKYCETYAHAKFFLISKLRDDKQYFLDKVEEMDEGINYIVRMNESD